MATSLRVAKTIIRGITMIIDIDNSNKEHIVTIIIMIYNSRNKNNDNIVKIRGQVVLASSSEGGGVPFTHWHEAGTLRWRPCVLAEGR